MSEGYTSSKTLHSTGHGTSPPHLPPTKKKIRNIHSNFIGCPRRNKNKSGIYVIRYTQQIKGQKIHFKNSYSETYVDRHWDKNIGLQIIQSRSSISPLKVDVYIHTIFCNFSSSPSIYLLLNQPT